MFPLADILVSEHLPPGVPGLRVGEFRDALSTLLQLAGQDLLIQQAAFEIVQELDSSSVFVTSSVPSCFPTSHSYPPSRSPFVCFLYLCLGSPDSRLRDQSISPSGAARVGHKDVTGEF